MRKQLVIGSVFALAIVGEIAGGQRGENRTALTGLPAVHLRVLLEPETVLMFHTDWDRNPHSFSSPFTLKPQQVRDLMSALEIAREPELQTNHTVELLRGGFRNADIHFEFVSGRSVEALDLNFRENTAVWSDLRSQKIWDLPTQPRLVPYHVTSIRTARSNLLKLTKHFLPKDSVLEGMK
jgi:hypothetical protein